MEDINTILENIDKKLFSDDVRQKISNLIEQKIQEKVDERVSLELEGALAIQYEKFKEAGKKLVEKIDEDHSQKMIHATTVIKENFSKKLVQLKEAHDKVVLETAQKHKDNIIEAVNAFIDINIEKNIPVATIAEAARNEYASNLLQEVRKFLAVDEKFISSNIKEAIVDGKRQLDSLQKENRELKKQKAIEESRIALDRKLENLPIKAAKFARKLLENKSATYIEENFKHVMDMYKRQEKTAIQEARQRPVVSVPERVKTATQVVSEAHTPQPQSNFNADNPLENFYMEGLAYKK